MADLTVSERALIADALRSKASRVERSGDSGAIRAVELRELAWSIENPRLAEELATS